MTKPATTEKTGKNFYNNVGLNLSTRCAVGLSVETGTAQSMCQSAKDGRGG